MVARRCSPEHPDRVSGFCLGCRLFARLVSVGVAPASVCEACTDVATHLQERSAAVAADRERAAIRR